MNDTAADHREDRPNVFLGPTFLLVSFIGTVGNGFVLYVYTRSPRLRDTTMTLIMNLALTDLFTAVTLGVNGIGVILNMVNESYLMCMTMMLVPTYMFFVSQSVLGITTFDRFVAICLQEKYTKIMTKMTLRSLLVTAWFFPLLLVGVPFLGFNYWSEIQTCRYRNLFHEWVYVTNSIIIIILMSISAILYVQILKKAWEFYRRFRPAQINGINAESNRIRAKQRAIKNGKVMGIVTIIFTICWLPSHIYQFFFGLDFKGNSAVTGITLTLGTLNCIINPFIYALQKKEFHNEAKKILKCSCSCRTVMDTENESEKDSNKNAKKQKDTFVLKAMSYDISDKATSLTSSQNLSVDRK